MNTNIWQRLVLCVPTRTNSTVFTVCALLIDQKLWPEIAKGTKIWWWRIYVIWVVYCFFCMARDSQFFKERTLKNHPPPPQLVDRTTPPI